VCLTVDCCLGLGLPRCVFLALLSSVSVSSVSSSVYSVSSSVSSVSVVLLGACACARCV
jgi:hypothetical protein